MDFHQLADKALRSIIPERAELKAVLEAVDEQLPELLSAAFKVRRHYYGKRVQIHVLQNAKSGLCPEDCHYCSQSVRFRSPHRALQIHVQRNSRRTSPASEGSRRGALLHRQQRPRSRLQRKSTKSPKPSARSAPKPV